ncbi:hypothetical protein Y5W_03445 [Alcanivorax sp. 521-1]|uniref:tRNA threonylcarbamoyladenosine biosynthesis protein TsaE n=1 Tax=Alloalcanivorax profundimaris TaxID=2735259 RepID=A0ABS0AVJ5_9GAMM|nr:tRNA (adenosine(37)-N6)-threonylcarbamoyltransferase complex ATPase subunit type 1 TsaE [Alloalcanivorax profundimaris]MBF5058151.1 hypothetical protein [Alloalcanivorax profundimaris]
MTTERHYLADEAATLELGADLGRRLAPGSCVYLRGDLGAGKTTLMRGLLHGLGHRGAVKSPTYTLVEPYEVGGVPIYHFDLYRLGDPEELEMIGIRDYFDGRALCVLEWPDRGRGMIPEPDLTVTLTVDGRGRQANLEWAHGQH